MKKYLFILITSLFFILQGCNVLMERSVLVEADANAAVKGGTYYLHYKGEPQYNNSSFESQLAESLKEQGYKRVSDPTLAEYHVYFKTTVSGPFQELNPWLNVEDEHGPYSNSWVQGEEYTNYYLQELVVSAFNRDKKLVWHVDGGIKMTTTDPVESFPYLLEAVSHYMDKNSGAIVKISVTPNELRADQK